MVCIDVAITNLPGHRWCNSLPRVW